MLDLFKVDDSIIMQLNFYFLLFLTLITILFYLIDRESHKIKFLVFGNLSYLLMHGFVLLAIADIYKAPYFVALFELLAVSFYILSFYRIFGWKIPLNRAIIYNLVHFAIIAALVLLNGKISTFRLITSIFILTMIIDAVIYSTRNAEVRAIKSFYNVLASVTLFFIYKLILAIYRVYTANFEVTIDSINASIVVFTIILLMFIIWINFTIMFINYDILNSKYRHLSFNDFLTDVPNRRYAMLKLNEAIIRSKNNRVRYGVIFLDIDGFKKYNDEFSHDFGDEILIEFVTKLKTLVRSNDLISRYGGDEFFIMLELKTNDELTFFINRIKNYFNKNSITKKNIFISFSIGKGYIDEKSSDNIKDIITGLDRELYISKKRKKELIKED